MKTRTWAMVVISTLFVTVLIAGCANAPANAPTNSTMQQIANPWKDATIEQAAGVLGGTMYNFATLDGSYKQYALMVTTDEAVKMKDGIPPTAWIRYQKGNEDVSLQILKGGKLSMDELKGNQADVNGVKGYIRHNDDGTAEIAWEAGGLLFRINTSVDWSNDALTALATGVMAVK